MRSLVLTFIPTALPGMIPVGFPCEKTPLDVGPTPTGLLPCKTVDLIVTITSTVLTFAVIQGAAIQLYMLYRMAINHRRNILSLRLGDWSVVPVQMRNANPGMVGRNLVFFVAFVWIQSSIGMIIFMVLCVTFFLLLTIPVLAIIGDSGVTTIFPDSLNAAIFGFLEAKLVGWVLYPLLQVAITAAIVVFIFTSGTRHQAISRNRDLFMWFETVATIVLIPLVMTKFVVRVAQMAISGQPNAPVVTYNTAWARGRFLGFVCSYPHTHRGPARRVHRTRGDANEIGVAAAHVMLNGAH